MAAAVLPKLNDIVGSERWYVPIDEKIGLLLEPGDYSLYYEAERSDNSLNRALPLSDSFSTDTGDRVSDVGVKLDVWFDDREVRVYRDSSMSYSVNERAGYSLLQFRASEAGTYYLELTIEEGREGLETGIYVIGKDWTGAFFSIVKRIGGLLLLLLPLFIWGLVRAIRGVDGQSAPHHAGHAQWSGYAQPVPRPAAYREGMDHVALNELTQTIIVAARAAFMELFASGERFYYCTLFTTGEGHAPYISAWSHEALAREATRLAEAGKGEAESLAEEIKWSYADSPYYAFAEARMADVEARYAQRPLLHELDETKAEAELQLRLQAMELAMRQLDAEGLFRRNQPRSEVVVLVEIMPPDPINTEIAKRLNDPAWPAMQMWLKEAAE
ncbi:DUF4303 domain-containing protein [Paenibacillus sp. 598K]|uniref:DUF4303 domain-containing protein n=1 Tax=Paenibacillus sp. 598K TaxID=1117987 RepID=UPI0021AACF5D|nr:DUF4303 domain-containing protein [Paenibacillus sp. 598K]